MTLELFHLVASLSSMWYSTSQTSYELHNSGTGGERTKLATVLDKGHLKTRHTHGLVHTLGCCVKCLVLCKEVIASSSGASSSF